MNKHDSNEIFLVHVIMDIVGELPSNGGENTMEAFEDIEEERDVELANSTDLLCSEDAA